MLRPGGRIVASIRLAEGNAYGSSGSPDKPEYTEHMVARRPHEIHDWLVFSRD